VPRYDTQGTPPRNRDQAYADPVEADPAARRELQTFGWTEMRCTSHHHVALAAGRKAFIQDRANLHAKRQWTPIEES